MYAEHRYYGKSLPFGEVKYRTTQNLAYLNTEQALADFVTLVKYIKEEVGIYNFNILFVLLHEWHKSWASTPFATLFFANCK